MAEGFHSPYQCYAVLYLVNAFPFVLFNDRYRQLLRKFTSIKDDSKRAVCSNCLVFNSAQIIIIAGSL